MTKSEEEADARIQARYILMVNMFREKDLSELTLLLNTKMSQTDKLALKNVIREKEGG